MNKHILIILDGYGKAVDPSVSAIDAANKPFLDHLFATYPHSTLEASGLAVGLPEGQMGNSEVGHMNLGAGRVVYQDITRIDKEISEGAFFENTVLKAAMHHAKTKRTNLHLMGLFSDGGVHASDNHLVALLEMAKREGLAQDQVNVHCFTDGRDTDPHGSLGYMNDFLQTAAKIGVGKVRSIIGRYYAMDRDNRWERTSLAYDLLVHGAGKKMEDPIQALKESHVAGITDEFMKPVLITDENNRSPRIAPGDAVICFNFRSDRMRQISRPFLFEDFSGFVADYLEDLYYCTFTSYDQTFKVPVAFPKVDIVAPLGEVISKAGFSQLRAAETEKYPHVTFFFNGGRETPFEGENRILAPSPKVATYDLKPEMSAPELAKSVAKALKENEYALVVLNFANPDMVGHTGVFEAAVKAIETVDECTKLVVETALQHGYSVEIIADHGNADKMRNEDGSPNTAHTTALVPHLIIKEGFSGPIQQGKLGDIAPTILHILGIPIPEVMNGVILI